MESKETLLKAVKMAHEAGDVASVEELSGVLDQYYGQPEVAPEKEGNFVGRSVERIVDAVGEGTANLYEGSGNPYNDNEPTDIPVVGPAIDWAARSLHSGGQIGEAVGDSIADVVGTGYEAIGSPFKEEGAEALGALMDTAPVKAVREAVGAATEEFPGVAQYVADAAAVGSLVNPAKSPKLPIVPGNKKRAVSAVARVEDSRRTKVKRLLEPDKDDWVDFEVTGKHDKTSWAPTEFEQSVLREVNELPTVKPDKSFAYNKKAVETQSRKLAEELKRDVAKHGKPVKVSSLYKRLDDAIQRVSKSPTLVGDAETSAVRMYETFKQRVQDAAKKSGDKTVSPSELLQIRKDLDIDLGDFDKLMAGTRTAKGTAGTEIRDVLNKLVQEATPEIDVFGSLGKQHRLLTAQKILRKRFDNEANGAVRRFIHNFERATGFRHPTTPVAATLTVTSLPVAAATLTGAVIYGTGAKVADKTLIALRKAIESPEYALKAAEKAAIISLITEYRQMNEDE